MQFSQTLGVVFSLAFLADALPGAVRLASARSPLQGHSVEARHIRTKRPVHVEASVGAASDLSESATAYQIYNFTLSKVELTNSIVNGTQSDHLSFEFLDQNSNTSTHCAQDFTPTPSPTDPSILVVPTDYVLCDHPTNFPNSTLGSEFFQFHLTNYTSPTKFGLTLAHEFNDPAHYAAPFSVVEYFADVIVNLVCKEDDVAGLIHICGLQEVDGEGELTAVINWISN